jgi:hypothetical protein
MAASVRETTEAKMRSFKATWIKAAPGTKKEAAFKHYSAAQKALAAKNEVDCNMHLNAAALALA